jgi:hypothetical protein
LFLHCCNVYLTITFSRDDMKRSGNISLVVVCSLLAFLIIVVKPLEAPRTPKTGPSDPLRSLAAESFKAAMIFEQNVGQVNPQWKYLARGPGYSILLGSSHDVLQLQMKSYKAGCELGRLQRKTEDQGNPRTNVPRVSFAGDKKAVGKTGCSTEPLAAIRLALMGSDRYGQPEGRQELASYSNYLIGSDPGGWHGHVKQFAEVWYPRIYPGIDLVFYGHNGQLEFDFVVSPHTDARQIAFTISDVPARTHLRENTSGDLIIPVGEKELVLRKPLVYEGKRCLSEKRAKTSAQVPPCKDLKGGKFRVQHRGSSNVLVAFELPNYDHNHELVIDPVVAFSTFLGGSGADQINGIAADSLGNVYVLGQTDSPDFPVTPGVVQTTLTGSGNAFISKFSADGSHLIYSTFLGGGGEDPHGIALDSSNNVYVTGETYAQNFPLVNPYISQNSSGTGFVSKLSPDGAALIYSTYLGGNAEGSCNAIAVDSAGEAVLVGRTFATNFPTVNASQSNPAGASDAFVTKLNASGSAAIFSTYLGGSSTDYGQGVAIDASGGIYVAGITYSSDFPTTPSSYQPTYTSNPYGVSFLSKFSASGGSLAYSTYLTGAQAFGLAVSTSGNAFLTGTAGPALPVTPGAFQVGPVVDTHPFVTQFDSTGSSLVYSTFLGSTGGSLDNGNAIALDPSNDAYLTGQTSSANFPLQNPVETSTPDGVPEAFVSELNAAGSQLVFSTYLGGQGNSGGQQGNAIAVDGSGNIYVGGSTIVPQFPVLNAWQPTMNGIESGFITKFLNQPAPNLSLNPTSISFPPEVVNVTSAPQTITVGNTGSAPLTVSNVTVNGDYAMQNGCASSIAPNVTCMLTVTSTPTSFGSSTGQINISSNATLTPVVVPLSGTGQDFGINGSPGTVPPISPGGTATLSVTLTPEEGFSQKVSFTCSGVPANSTCSISPPSVTLDGVHTATATATITTTAAGTTLRAPRFYLVRQTSEDVGLQNLLFTIYAVLLFLLLLRSDRVAISRPLRAFRIVCVVIPICLMLAGCGANGGGKGGGGNGGGNSGGGNGGTPAGNYFVTVWAKSGNVSHGEEFTITVE